MTNHLILKLQRPNEWHKGIPLKKAILVLKHERGVLNFKDRELITITSLLTQGGCENQLRVHIQASLNVGLTQEEIIETFIHYAPYVGFPRVLNAIFVAKEIFTDRK